MIIPAIAVRHVKLEREEPCGVCGASFVAAEDSGSRVVLVRQGDDTFTGLMCGGCASKWTHGTLTASFRNAVKL